MSSRLILFVDDEPHVLDGIKRQLRRRFEVETAAGAAEAMRQLNHGGPYAVIVSDMRMPVMDGGRFLAHVKKVSPDTVRIMLTGNADVQTATAAVNDSEVFRFLTKPVEPATLEATLDAALKQHELITAERELLVGTVSGAVRVLTEVLSLVNPAAFGRATRAAEIVRPLADALAPELAWDLDMAAMLSQIGCVTVPQETLGRQERGEALTRNEVAMLERQAEIGRALIAHIPRLERVATIVGGQAARPQDASPGAAILKTALDYDLLTMQGHTPHDAVGVMAELQRYPEDVLTQLRKVAEIQQGHQMISVPISGLKPGMVLGQALTSRGGLLLVAKGQHVTDALSARVRNHCTPEELTSLVEVLIPLHASGQHSAA